MRDSEIAEFVRANIVRELQAPGVREIILRHMRAELLTGVPGDPVVIAQEISAYIRERMMEDEP